MPELLVVLSDPDIVLSHDDLVNLYKNRCVKCLMTSYVRHEISPRSVTPNWQRWSNQVVLCAECHDWAHHVGTKVSGPILVEFRDKRLQEFYGHL